jgi:putative transposase
MPNHVHGILIFDKNSIENIDVKFNPNNKNVDGPVETGHCPVSTKDYASPQETGITNDLKNNNKAETHFRFRNQGKHTVSSIIGSYKSICTKHIRKVIPEFEWQTRFWDNIIRDDDAFNTISQYIINNPLTWENDKLFGEETDNSIEKSSILD